MSISSDFMSLPGSRSTSKTGKFIADDDNVEDYDDDNVDDVDDDKEVKDPTQQHVELPSCPTCPRCQLQHS